MRRRPCATEVPPQKVAIRWSRISTRTRSIFSPTTTTPSASRWCCRRGFRLLVNGAGGIAVGMATNIPPHNLGEVIDAGGGADRQSALSIEELNAIVPGPDFPTGGIILGRAASAQPINSAAAASSCAARSNSNPCAASAKPSSFPKSVSGEQGPYGRTHRRTGAREKDRGHFGSARRIRPRRLSRRDRAAPRAVPDVVLNELYRFTALQTSSARTLWRCPAAVRW